MSLSVIFLIIILIGLNLIITRTWTNLVYFDLEQLLKTLADVLWMCDLFSEKFSEIVATNMINGILSKVGCLDTPQSSIKENKCNLGDVD